MMFENNDTDESVKSILDELATFNKPSHKNELAITSSKDIEIPKLEAENLEQFILEKVAATVVKTDLVIDNLLDSINSTPDNSELIESVATMLSSSHKSLETLTKMHLSKEKLNHAKELEVFKAQAKSQTKEKERPYLTKDEIMELIGDD